jgi:hypothetical protein
MAIPIRPHPDWRPAQGRETLQAGIVRQFKEELWDATEIIRFYAGSSPKPGHAVAGAKHLVNQFMAKLPQLRNMNRLSNGWIQQFNDFAAVWNDGDGSWTQSRALIMALNDAMADLQP